MSAAAEGDSLSRRFSWVETLCFCNYACCRNFFVTPSGYAKLTSALSMVSKGLIVFRGGNLCVDAAGPLSNKVNDQRFLRGVFQVKRRSRQSLLTVGIFLLALLVAACGGGPTRGGSNTPGDPPGGGGPTVPPAVAEGTGTITFKIDGDDYERFTYMVEAPAIYEMPPSYSATWKDEDYGVYEIELLGVVDLNNYWDESKAISISFDVEHDGQGRLEKPKRDGITVTFDGYTTTGGETNVEIVLSKLQWKDGHEGELMEVEGTFFATVTALPEGNSVDIQDGSFAIDVVGPHSLNK